MTNRIRAGSDYPALTLSDLTDRLRRTPGVFITRNQLEAMLDVIDAAEQSVSPKRMGSGHQEAGRGSGYAGRGSGYCDSCLRSWPCEGSELRVALARFREVAGKD